MPRRDFDAGTYRRSRRIKTLHRALGTVPCRRRAGFGFPRYNAFDGDCAGLAFLALHLPPSPPCPTAHCVPAAASVSALAAAPPALARAPQPVHWRPQRIDVFTCAMSKKNRLSTRRRAHAFSLKMEQKARLKVQKGALKRKVKHAADVAADELAKLMAPADAPTAADAPSTSGLGASSEYRALESHYERPEGGTAAPEPKPDHNAVKFQRRMPRLRKGAVVRGIKIVDAATRKQVEAILAAEKEGKMDMG